MNDSMEATTRAIATIQAAAQAQWGEDWIAQLCREYCRLENLEKAPGEKPATPKNRRSILVRLFEQGSGNADTLFRAAESAGCRIRITHTL